MASARSLIQTIRADLAPLLGPLDHEAKRIAFEVCLSYRLAMEFRGHINTKDQEKRLRLFPLNIARKLKLLRKSLASLQRQIDPLCDSIRSAHIPKTLFDLIPSDIPAERPINYLRRWRDQDPAQAFVTFCAHLSEITRSIDLEAIYLRKSAHETRNAGKYPLSPHWQHSAVAYTLIRLFDERSKTEVAVGEAEKTIARILTLLDGGGRTPDSIRKSVKRFRTWPKYRVSREACDRFVNYRFEFKKY